MRVNYVRGKFFGRRVAALFAVLMATSAMAEIQPRAVEQQTSPNVLLIVADDLGYSDISPFGGSDIHTPNLQQLAEHGVALTLPTCAPTRSVLLTGADNHLAGKGAQVITPEQQGRDGYEGHLNDRVLTLAEVLAGAGYRTYFSGKWHLGEGSAHEPTGFDEWDILPGQGQYFDPNFINSEGKHTEKGYVTDIITDKAIDFIERARETDEGRPFFAMVHHKAPHRSWECDPKHKHLYKDPIKLPET